MEITKQTEMEKIMKSGEMYNSADRGCRPIILFVSEAECGLEQEQLFYRE